MNLQHSLNQSVVPGNLDPGYKLQPGVVDCRRTSARPRLVEREPYIGLI